MKKYIVILLALLTLLTLTACRRQPSALSEDFDPGTPVTAAPTPTAASGVAVMEHPIAAPGDNSPAPETVSPAPVAPPVASPSAIAATPQATSTPENSEMPEATNTPSEPSATAVPTAPAATEAPAAGHIPNSTAYEQYNNMSGEEQLAFMESFDSVEAFVAWLNAAKADYEASNPPIEITGDVIDLSELLG